MKELGEVEDEENDADDEEVLEEERLQNGGKVCVQRTLRTIGEGVF